MPQEPNTEKNAVIYVTLDSILANPFQPPSRLKVDEATAEKFGRSISENGLSQYPVVRVKESHFEVADGWRRLAGFRWLVEHERMELFRNIPVIVEKLTDAQMLATVLETGTVRDDLTPIDLAHIYRQMQTDLGITQEEIAKKHNCSQGEIANTIRLLDLPENIQHMIISQEITETHGRYLLMLQNKPEELAKMAARIVAEKLNVSALDYEIKLLLQRESKPRGNQPTSPPPVERKQSPPEHKSTGRTADSVPREPDNEPKEKELTLPAGEVVTPPAVEPVKIGRPRKVNLNELPDGVFCGVMRFGNPTSYTKKLFGTIETVNLKSFLEEAEAFWAAGK